LKVVEEEKRYLREAERRRRLNTRKRKRQPPGIVCFVCDGTSK
jgi:hypothetical protein